MNKIRKLITTSPVAGFKEQDDGFIILAVLLVFIDAYALSNLIDNNLMCQVPKIEFKDKYENIAYVYKI